MIDKRKMKPRTFLFLGIILILLGLYSLLDYLFLFSTESDIRHEWKLPIAIVVFSLGIIQIMEFLISRKHRKIYHIIGLIFIIPLTPLFVIGILSQTRFVVSLTLPIIVLSILTLISTFTFQQLELLQLGNEFNENVIPYLNLTTITVVFIFLDKFLVKALSTIIPEHQMPKAVKDITFEFLEKRPFIKIAYVLLTCLFIISTIESLGKTNIFYFIDTYKNIALQSLVTFAAIDRLLSKWKSR